MTSRSDERVLEMVSEAATFLTSSTEVGRIYGQGMDDECMFDTLPLFGGDHVINVRTRGAEAQSIMMPRRTTLLVQLFERPDTLWLASVVRINGEWMIMYSPVSLPEVLDGRSEAPELAVVTERQQAEGVTDEMEHRLRRDT